MSEFLAGRKAVKARQIRPGEAFADEVRSGQLVQITTVQGKQVADFVVFGLDDLAEHLSTAVTRAKNSSIMLQTGMKLYSNRRTPLFEIVEDTVGRHDLLFAACDPRRYEEDYGLPNHASCRSALADALADTGATYDQIPDPVNWFMNVAILQRGELELRESLAERNDYVLLEALADTRIGVSACPQDQNPTNNFAPSDVLVRVFS
ncbi:MAG: DUF1989 domain-containing protein [Thermomicrobiales bacterium]